MKNELYYQEKAIVAHTKKAKKNLKEIVAIGNTRDASFEDRKNANHAAYQLEVISRNKLRSPFYSLVFHQGMNRRQRRLSQRSK